MPDIHCGYPMDHDPHWSREQWLTIRCPGKPRDNPEAEDAPDGSSNGSTGGGS